MRDLTANDSFLKLKHVEKVLEQKYPADFRSRYSMVCYGSALHGNITYANALGIGKVIDSIGRDVVHAVEKETRAAYIYKNSWESLMEQEQKKFEGQAEQTRVRVRTSWVTGEKVFSQLLGAQAKVVERVGKRLVDERLRGELRKRGMDLRTV